MEIKIDTKVLELNNLTPDEFVLLKLFYHKEFGVIKNLFGVERSKQIRDNLSSFFLSTNNEKFTESIISKEKVGKLLGERCDIINFWEFYNEYPVRVGSRVLRAAGPTTAIALKHQEKYLKRVKTVEQHELAIESIKAFVAMQKRANKLSFLPNMETVMNNSMWEMWCSFIQEVGTEEQEWNNNTI